jgi:hypothetical protein
VNRPGLTTWTALPAFDGPVLLVVNTPAPAAADLQALVSLLAGKTDGLHLIAGAAHAGMLPELPPERVLLAQDASGRDIEINHFLETSIAVRWVVPKAFRAIVGLNPHNLYNEEVQGPFEARAALLLGDGVFLAHCLPTPYLYVLDGQALVHRFSRDAKVAQYRQQATALIDDLHAVWLARGRPVVDDSDDYAACMAVVERHLGRPVIDFDEASPIRVLRGGEPVGGAAAYLTHLRDTLHDRDRLLLERSDAVAVRDQILERISKEELPDRLRRLMGRSK